MTFSESISLTTAGFTDIVDITDKVIAVIERSGIENGLVTVFCPGVRPGLRGILSIKHPGFIL